jgi:BON domain-containing protein
MFRSLDFYRGLAVGLGAMYLLDPERGRTRRALLRGRAVRTANAVQDFLGKSSRDLSQRATGGMARAAARLHPDDADETLAERVRAKLGRYVSHPNALEVEAQDGSVLLRGPILGREVEELVDAISSVRGVREVVNRLEPHATADGVPALQGHGRAAGARGAFAPTGWTLGVQVLAGIIGAAVVTVCASRVASRLRRASAEELESEMPEYAMLR